MRTCRLRYVGGALRLGVLLLCAQGSQEGLGAQQAPRAAPQGAATAVLQRSARPQGWVGISIELRETWRAGVAQPAPVMVITDVHPSSPAALSGLQVGDTIVRINAEAAGPEALARALSTLDPGRTLTLSVRRGGSLRAVAVRSTERPAEDALLSLPADVRFQLDSLRRELALHVQGQPGQGGVFVFRTGTAAAPDSARIFVFSAGEDGRGAQLAFETLPSGGGVLPDRSSLDVLLERQSTPAQGTAALTRQMAGDAARRAEFVIARTTAAPTGASADHSRPLAPYILGQDWIAGARLTPLNAGLADYFGVRRGLLVVDVAPGTPAADAGVVPGDVLLSADGREVTTLDALRAQVAGERRTGTTRIILVRKGSRIEVALPR